MLAERDRLNESLQHVIDAQTEPWGIKVTTVEIKDVEIPERMQHAIARQAEAERERRAKIINAEGEFQAAAKLAEAAEVIAENPITIQLRYLQTLREIGANQNSTIVFPIDIIKPMLDSVRQSVLTEHRAAPENGELPGPEERQPPGLAAAPADRHAAPAGLNPAPTPQAPAGLDPAPTPQAPAGLNPPSPAQVPAEQNAAPTPRVAPAPAPGQRPD